MKWLREFPTTAAIGFIAIFLTTGMCIKAIVMWDSPPEGLAIFLGGLIFGGIAQFYVKRSTDHNLVQIKETSKVKQAQARASQPQTTIQAEQVDATIQPGE